MAIPRLQTANQVFPAAASGTTVTPSGSAWTFGAYAQIVASVGADLLLATVTVGPTSAGAGVGEAYEIEIAVGAPGSEVAICTLPANVENGTFGQHTLRLPYPIKIASGSRVAARIRRGTTSVSTSAVAITCVPQAFTGVLFPTTAAAKALPSGSAPIATAGISWATGAIVQLVAATASDSVVYALSTGPTGLGWTAEYEVDLLTGTPGSEVVVATIRDATSAVNDPGWHLLPAPIVIPAGTRVSAQARSSAGGTRDLFVNALYYDNPGVDAPADTLATAPAVIVPSAAAAITVSFPTGAGSATYGAWVEFTAAAAQALTLFGAVPTSLIMDTQIQVGVGAAGSEVSIATLQIGGRDANKEQAYVTLPIGVALIPAGARIAVRARAGAAAGSFDLSLLLMPTSGVGASAQATLVPQVLPDIIATTPASVGLQMSGSGSAWTNSAWVEFTTGLAHQIGIYGISQNAGIADPDTEIDLGIGAAGSEVAIYTFRFHTSVDGRHNVPALAPIVVAAGTRIAMRVRSGTGLTIDADIQYYDSFTFEKVGSFAIGYKANVNASQAVAISVESAGGTLAESGKVKIFGKLDVTGITTFLSAVVFIARFAFSQLVQASAASVLLGRGAGAGAGDFQELTLGTGLSLAGTVLSATGGGGSGGGGGSLVLLGQLTAAASATLDFTGLITSTYDEYLIEIIDLIPATNGVDLYLRLSTDGGATYDATAKYASTILAWNGSGGSAFTGDTIGSPATQFPLRKSAEIGNDANYGVSGRLRLFNPGGATYKRILSEYGYMTNSTDQATVRSSGVYLNATAVDAFRFLFSAGNLASGTIRVYGVAKTTTTASSQGDVLLEEHTVAGTSSIDFTTRNATGQSGATFQTDFDEYRIEIVNVVNGSSAIPRIRFSTDGGVTYDSSTNYEWGWVYNYSGGTGSIFGAAATSLQWRDTATTLNASGSWNGTLCLKDPTSALWKSCNGQISLDDNSAGLIMVNGGGRYRNTSVVNAMRVDCSAGTLSGTVRIYGVSK